MSKTTIDTIATFKTVAGAIFNGTQALAIINHRANELREAGVKFGKSKKTCEYRVQFADAMKAAFQGKAEKTYANYVTAFVACVNDKTEFSFSHSKGKGKAKGKGTDKDETIFPVLAKLFGHPDFATTMASIQAQYDNAEGDLTDLIRSALEADGYEIKD